MSVSSGSDITIPIQDSPPPPPSPYANTKQSSNTNTATSTSKSLSKNGDPASNGPGPGIDNVGYQQSESNRNNKDANNKSNAKHTTMVDMNGTHSKGTSTPSADNGPINEAVNGEIINMSVLDSIPHKPQAEFGPYENFDEYFMAVNKHKKYIRGEKLYVTKDKRKSGRCKKYTCWLFGALVLAAIITMAVLAAVGLLPPGSTPAASRTMASTPRTTTTTTVQPPEEFFSSSEFSSSSESDFMTVSPPTTDSPPPATSGIYVPDTAEVEFTLSDAEYEEALGNPSSEQFRRLADTIETELKNTMETDGGLNTSYVRVLELASGSIVAKVRISWMDPSKDFTHVQRFINTIHALGGYTVRPGVPSYAVLNKCKMNNNECSHYCTFDYESLDFLCTCPERLILATTDNKTCQGQEPEVQESESEPSPSPPAEEVEPQSPDVLTTPTPTITTSTETPLPEEVPTLQNDSTSAKSQPQPQPQPTKEPAHPEVVTVAGEPSSEVEAESSPEVPSHEHEAVHPAPGESTPTPLVEGSDENMSLANDTAHAPPDFDYNTENVEAVVAPEVSQQQHENEPIISLVTTAAPTPVEEATPAPAPAPIEPDSESPEQIVDVPQEQGSESHATTTTMIPGIVSDAVMIPSEAPVVVDEDSIVLTTVLPELDAESRQEPEDELPSNGEVVRTVGITPKHSSVEIVDEIPPTSAPSAEEHDTGNPSAEEVEILAGAGEQRNASVTRALLKNYETVEEVSNSNEGEPQSQDEQMTTTVVPQPEISSNEFMAFSDLNMSLVNAHLTPKTPEADIVQDVTEKVPSSASVETMTSYETHNDGPDASVSGEDHPSFDEQLILDEILTTTSTTLKPFTLENDTAVNHMTDGITADPIHSEPVTTVTLVPQPAHDAESVTEVPAQNGESRELVHGTATESPENANSNEVRVVSAEVGDNPTDPPAVDVEATTVHPHVHELSQSVAGFISHSITTTPIPSSAENVDADAGSDSQQPSIVSTTIDILRRNSSTPPPNPYDVLSHAFSQYTTSEPGSAPAPQDNQNANANVNDADDSQQSENNSGNELE